MSFLKNLLGRRLPVPKGEKRELSILTGVPALGLDAIASTAYGPEAALTILVPLGVAGLNYFLPITAIVIGLLVILYFSYRQTTAAYPGGGGAYIVASDNFGKTMGVWAAVALLADYLLNVAVGIAAGIGTVVSALPILQPYTLILCLAVLLTLTLVNLRGSQAPGAIFLIPLILFVVCLGGVLIIGLVKLIFDSTGHPVPIIAPPALPQATQKMHVWLLLGALANALTALTGIEAVSNAVPIFRRPSVQNAQWTLTIILLILALLLVGLAFLVPAYNIGAMLEQSPGYLTVLSQLVAAVMGHGVFYYISIASMFIVLTYSAQTSFVDFPRVCKLLAQDDFLPRFLAIRGRRLVYSNGIIILGCTSALILIIFKGLTYLLIPLFAVGAFSAFLFSQAGMVMHWYKKGIREHWYNLLLNGIGAVTTGAALVIIIAQKFLQGAWVIVIFVPVIVWLLLRINAHYRKIQRVIDKPLNLQRTKLKKPIVIIPIGALDYRAEKALRMALLISDTIYAVNVSRQSDSDTHPLRIEWNKKVESNAEIKKCNVNLKIVQSLYDLINEPIVKFVKKIKAENPEHVIAIIIPELVEPHWYEYLLHTVRAKTLRATLLRERDEHIIVINIPWYLTS